MIKQYGLGINNFSFMTFGFGDSTAIYNPVTLFGAGQQGAIYDPSDLTTLFQDAAGTVPVTKSGDPVGLMKDKSGNGYHASQSISTSRPTYQTDGILHWLQRDGVDDFMSINRFSSVIPQPFSAIFADKAEYTSAQYRFLFDSEAINRSYVFKISGPDSLWINSGSTTDKTTFGLRDGVAEVSAFLFSGANSKFRTNKQVASNVVLGTSGIQGMTLFSRATGVDTLKGRFYGCVLIAGTDYDNAELKQYLAAKAGVTL